MCSVVILLRPDHDWPVLIAANRDERMDRPWLAPARHWPDRPDVTGGLDVLAGGSWLGINDLGVSAILLNTPGTLGPDPDKRSRGELVLESLDLADAIEAAQAMASINPESYRPFHLLIADNRDVYFLSLIEDKIVAKRLESGLFMATAHGLNSPKSHRFCHYHPLFSTAKTPNPLNEDWAAWLELLTDRGGNNEIGASGGMFIATDHDFGTSSTSLLALPSINHVEYQPVFRFMDYQSAKPVISIIPPFIGPRHYQS